MRPRSSYSKWDVILILLLVVVIVVGIVLWISEKEEHANWQEGEWLDVVLACPPSYKVSFCCKFLGVTVFDREVFLIFLLKLKQSP